VIVLDENILDGQRLLLEGWKIAVRQVGLDVGRKGLEDDDVVVLLRRLHQVTFFTRDLGFYAPSLRHPQYVIAVMAVRQYEVAAFIRRFLRHPLFDAHAKRAGRILRVAPTGIAYWQLRQEHEKLVGWEVQR